MSDGSRLVRVPCKQSIFKIQQKVLQCSMKTPIFSINFNSCLFIFLHTVVIHQDGDDAGNTVGENSNIFSLIRMSWLPSASAYGQ